MQPQPELSPFFPGIFSRRLSRIWFSLSLWRCRRSSGLQSGLVSEGVSSPFLSLSQLSLGTGSFSGSSGLGSSPGACSGAPSTSSIRGRESSSWFKSLICGFERSDFQDDLAGEEGFKTAVFHTFHLKGQFPWTHPWAGGSLELNFFLQSLHS